MRHKRIYQGVNYVEVNGTTAEDLYNRNIEILVVREFNTSCYDYLRVKKTFVSLSHSAILAISII